MRSRSQVEGASDPSAQYVGSSGVKCTPKTEGFTGEKPVVTTIQFNRCDPCACPVAVVEAGHFENGLLKSIT